jgi:cold shock CspA family protein
MKNGIVKNYFANRGFGFIRAENEKDFFYHISKRRGGLLMANGYDKRKPEDGDRVVFDVIQGKKGSMASPWYFFEDWELLEKQKTASVSVQTTVGVLVEVLVEKPEVVDVKDTHIPRQHHLRNNHIKDGPSKWNKKVTVKKSSKRTYEDVM